MSTSSEPSVAPAFAEQFAELQACGLPAHILESAARLGEATLTLDAHEAFTYEVDTERIIIPGGERAVSERIYSGLLVSGRVSEGDLAHVKAVAQTVLEQDNKALEAAVIDSYAAFATGFLNPDKVTAKDPPMWRLFSVAKHTAEQTDQHLLTSGALRDGKLLFYNQKAWVAAYVEEPDQLKLFAHPVEEDIDALRALSMVDVMADVLRLPDGFVTDSRKQGAQADLRPILMAGLVSRLGDAKEFRAFAPTILGATRNKGRLNSLREIINPLGGLRTYFGVLAEVLIDYQRIEKYAGAHQAVRDAVARHNEVSAERIRAQGDATTLLTNQAVQQLDQLTREYVAEAPSPERMLGALSVENWLQRVVPTSYSRSEQKTWLQRHRSLHEAVEEGAHQDQIAELKRATEPLQTQVQAIDEKYTITGHALRQLPGGLELRRELNSYLELGSRRVMFMKDQAQQLVGLALQLAADPERQRSFADDVAVLHRTWTDIVSLQGKDTARTGLIQTIGLLVECYENVPVKLLRNTQLQSIWQLARLSQQALSTQEQPADSE